VPSLVLIGPAVRLAIARIQTDRHNAFYMLDTVPVSVTVSNKCVLYCVLLSLLTIILQLHPRKRISANVAIQHRYFADLPYQLIELQDGKCVFDCVDISNL